MGYVGMRFGRNIPRTHTKPPNHEELLSPNPRVVSERLLARDKFKPATILNLLAAAWIQFQIHDWFMHINSATENWDVPVPEGSTWKGEIKIEKTQPDDPLDDKDKQYPAYKNKNTHWWDGSQIYGSSEMRTAELRGSSKNGRLTVDKENLDTFLPRDE
ncbi:hypothetical protein H2201_008603 [Coniosporium apollinis]|uniref:Uncharacterized protein n=2 Tax=Coniosporium TaxID=2810619 RepID=A0ABQ9NGJ8_9PEZI|nr:hypothetical protein H2199_005297 [Cladosporium sp. JES 115]KAJ9656219.1 hypothetical protein H2201_008603 [Coniosporium apollinis]